MTPDYYNQLTQKYPALFEKSQIRYMAVGDGWNSIIDTLCEKIYSQYQFTQNTLNGMVDNHDNESRIQVWREQLGREAAQLPVILQVKEKFGELRFYMKGGTAAHEAYVDFACAMSIRVCEVCGAPGQRRDTRWVKTLCDTHYQEQITAQRMVHPAV